jgi:hypothetical protein
VKKSSLSVRSPYFLIYVEGGVTRSVFCFFCQGNFVYLFRDPQHRFQKHEFSSLEEEYLWKQEEQKRIESLLSQECLIIPCPSCKRLQPEMRRKYYKKWISFLKKLFLCFILLLFFSILARFIFFQEASASFTLFNFTFWGIGGTMGLFAFLFFLKRSWSEKKRGVFLAQNLSARDAFEYYYRVVCALLVQVVRFPEKSEFFLHQVTEKVYQRPWKADFFSPWSEDLLWILAHLSALEFEEETPLPPREWIKKVFQAAYTLNAIDPSVYPALPKKIMEFFCLEVQEVMAWILELELPLQLPGWDY